MGRPPLGPAKRSRTIAIHVTQDQHELIEQQGKPAAWVRRVVLDALLTAITPSEPTQPPPPRRKTAKTPNRELPTPAPALPGDHRHKRKRIGEHWVHGTDVGKYECETCGVTMGVLQ